MKRIAPLSLVMFLAVVLVSGVAPVWAAQCGPGSVPPKAVCQCGDTVVDDYTVPADLTCTGNGLTLESGVNLNLGSRTITGTNKTGLGLVLVGTGGAVHNGKIQNFNIGIVSPGNISAWQIGNPSSGLSVTKNRRGLDLNANLTTLTDMGVTSNLSEGIVLEGNTNTILKVSCSQNGGTGLSVTGDSNNLTQNRCERNGGNGMDVRGQDNFLIRNLAGSNGGTGVLVLGNGNNFQRNQGRSNDNDGVFGMGANLISDGQNYGTGNDDVNCHIDGFPTTGGGKYC